MNISSVKTHVTSKHSDVLQPLYVSACQALSRIGQKILDLISTIAREVEIKEEEELDLLRDMKGQKFSAEELERELQETIQRFKTLAGRET